MQLLIMMTSAFVSYVCGHGRLTSPPGRSTMWRYGYNTPPNYNDNQLFCGGFYEQWTLNKGKCGICGDPWNKPRENEAGGKYATGIITETYKEGDTISVQIELTATHGGYHEFRVCPVNDPNTPATQYCLDRYLLQQPNGATKFSKTESAGKYSVSLMLPRGLSCTQCVLQWKWNTGNSYGCDTSGQNCCVGCGPQEQFYGCADIAITPSPPSSLSGNVHVISSLLTTIISLYISWFLL